MFVGILKKFMLMKIWDVMIGKTFLVLSDSRGLCFHFKNSLVTLVWKIKIGHIQLPVTKNARAFTHSLLFYWDGHGHCFSNVWDTWVRWDRACNVNTTNPYYICKVWFYKYDVKRGCKYSLEVFKLCAVFESISKCNTIFITNFGLLKAVERRITSLNANLSFH